MFFPWLFLLSFLVFCKADMTTIIDFLSEKRKPDFKEPVHSACDIRYSSAPLGFHCPHMYMFSDDMLLAQEEDNLFDGKESYVYATAGSYSDMECGKCYLVNLKEEGYPFLLLQVINSGSDIQRGHFDIMIPAGGFGYYNACSQDCKKNYCGGGPCHLGMFDGSFQDWNNFQYSCYQGGLHWTKQDGIQELFRKCNSLVVEKDTIKNRITFQSCVRANLNGFYRNFEKIDFKRVQCPPSLIKVTGMQRQDDIYYSLPEKDKLDFDSHCSSKTCITTMNDCCKPSCAWQKNIATEWNRVYTCNQDGVILSS